LDLNFGKKVLSANPAEVSKDWGDNIYQLNTNLKMTVKLSQRQASNNRIYV